MMDRVFFKKILVLSSGNFINSILSGIFGIYITRTLGPEDKGVLTIALSSCDLVMMLFSLGIPYSAAYYIRSQPGSESFVLSQAYRIMIICGLSSLVLVLSGKGIFSSLFLGGRVVDSAMAALLILTVIVNSGNTIIGATLVAQGISDGYVLSTNIGTLVTVVFTIVLIAALNQFKLHAVLLGNLTGVLTTMLIMRRFFRMAHRAGSPMSQQLKARDFYSYGIQAQIGAIAALAFKRLDLYIISYFLNPGAVGYYSVGVGLRDMAMTAARALAGLAAGDMADPERQNDGTAGKILKKGIFFNIVTSLLAFVGAVLIFPYFIPFAYGELFTESITTSIIIMGSLLPFSIAFLLGKAIQSKGKPLHQSISNIISAVICSLVVWQFTKRFGITGAATATIIDSTVLAVLSFIFLKASGDWRSRDSQIKFKRISS